MVRKLTIVSSKMQWRRDVH